MRATDLQIDWFRVVTDLQRGGLSLRDIGLRVDRAVVTIHAWMHSNEPKHRDGELLIALWCVTTGNVRDSVPTVRQTRPRSVLLTSKEAVP